MADGKGKELEPIKDKKTVDRYLRYALELNELITCAVDGTDVTFDALPISIDHVTNTFEIEIDESTFTNFSVYALEMIDRQGSLLRINYTVHEVLLFGRGAIRERNMRRLRLVMEPTLFKMQRREALRIKPLLAHEASIKVDNVTYNIHDISANGLSVIVAIEDLKPFLNKGEVKKTCRLSFCKLEADVDIEIASQHRSKKDATRFKIGFRFLNLTGPIEQKIAQEAYTQTHQIWSRWL